MASKLPMFACLVFAAVLCFALLGDASDCNTGCGLFGANSAVSMKTENRKMLASLKKKKKETVKGGLQVSATISNGGGFLGWELSRVPSGPDPLHHNGGNPKKPRAL